MSRFLAFFIFLLASSSHTAINIVSENQLVQLMSSEERGGFNENDEELNHVLTKRAEQMCHRVQKDLTSFELFQPDFDTLKNWREQKIYGAHKWISSHEGLVFIEGKYRLASYPRPLSRREASINNERICYAGAVTVLISGGFMSFLMAIGMEGSNDLHASFVTGCITSGLSGLTALGGLAFRFFRERFITPDIEMGELIQETYALPVLVSKILCQ